MVNKKKLISLLPIIMELLDSDTEEQIYEQRYFTKERRKRIAITNYVTNVALMYQPDDFKSHFRLRRDTFEHLIITLGPYWKVHGTNTTGVGRPQEAPEKQLLIVLSMLVNQEVYRTVAEKCDTAKSTAWSYVHKISAALVKLAPHFIKWPSGAKAVQTMLDFAKRQEFVRVIGALDGSHIPITPPRAQQTAYCNRKKYHSIILQAVCDANYMFTDVFAGYPGSVHDARVFRNSDLAHRIENNPLELFPNDSHILADSAYANGNHVLTPYRDNGHLSRMQKDYNYKHSSTRVYIEQTFGLLKGRFRILKHINIYRTELIPTIIVACCVLHNICMERADNDVEPYLDNDRLELKQPYVENDATGLNKRNVIAQMLYRNSRK